MLCGSKNSRFFKEPEAKRLQSMIAEIPFRGP